MLAIPGNRLRLELNQVANAVTDQRSQLLQTELLKPNKESPFPNLGLPRLMVKQRKQRKADKQIGKHARRGAIAGKAEIKRPRADKVSKSSMAKLVQTETVLGM